MNINAALLIQLRNERFWTQEELATKAGLNLRTIQRIEKNGTASLHSKKLLASAFDIDVHDLDYEEKQMLHELVGRSVEIRIHSFNEDRIKGKVLRVEDAWIEIATKKDIEFVNIAAIRRIILPSK
ncbi:MAG: helix-turn-helix transcriptional regulator [Chloroflexi bacterium]|nr:helix-turn-helix transcriptional regulator [Chloroflexota bacterium]